MGEVDFETALGARVDEMVDACTRCGKCVEVCPSVAPAGIADAKPTEVIAGVLDILRTGTGPEALREADSRWREGHDEKKQIEKHPFCPAANRPSRSHHPENERNARSRIRQSGLKIGVHGFH
jgi:Fe-S oxidoreductase